MLSLRERKIISEMLKRGEGNIPYFYQDTVGLVTVGVGNMVPNAEAAALLDFIHPDGTPATEAEKRQAYEAVRRAPGALTGGEELSAEWYAKLSTIRMHGRDIDTLLSRRIDEFYTKIKKLYLRFDSFPGPARLGIFDMSYNLGHEKFKRTYLRFHVAVREGDWKRAAQECYRKGPSPQRNAEIRQLFLEAAAIEGGGVTQARKRYP